MAFGGVFADEVLKLVVVYVVWRVIQLAFVLALKSVAREGA